MLGWLTLVVAVLALAANTLFWFFAFRGYLAWRRAARAPDPARWPRAHVIVCLKGGLPRIRETAEALDRQDYAGPYRVTFVTEASAGTDEAAAALAPILPAHSRCDHVVAGGVLEREARCAQKNFNLLAGVRHARHCAAPAAVYAFCDGDLLVHSGWLREMVRPLATGASDASTSFHWVASEGRRIIEALHGIAEAAQSMTALVCRGSTWGGSMAIRADAFERHGLEELWSRTVVDDVSASRAFRIARLRVTPVPRFLVQTRSELSGYRGFVRWLGRQYFFVKVYLPRLYGLLWAKQWVDVATLWLAAYHVAHFLTTGEWPAGPVVGLLAVGTSAALLGTLHLFRYLLPQRPSASAWWSATLLAPGASFLACADASWRRRRLVWRDLTYVVRRDGSVELITQTGPGPAPLPEPPSLTEAA
jgi:hypothetical protein